MGGAKHNQRRLYCESKRNQRLLAASAPAGATVIYTPNVPKTRMYYIMKLVCRKCGLECDATTFEEVEQYQRMTCGAGGTHRLVGRA